MRNLTLPRHRFPGVRIRACLVWPPVLARAAHAGVVFVTLPAVVLVFIAYGIALVVSSLY